MSAEQQNVLHYFCPNCKEIYKFPDEEEYKKGRFFKKDGTLLKYKPQTKFGYAPNTQGYYIYKKRRSKLSSLIPKNDVGADEWLKSVYKAGKKVCYPEINHDELY